MTVIIPTVNFHLLENCNMKCTFCYVPNIGKSIDVDKACKLIQVLSKTFKKINFAGGEPLLYPNLDSLIQKAKNYGMTTSLVTNGTKITDDWLDKICRYLDWIALSIDSDNIITNMQSGRMAKTGPISKEQYLDIARSIKLHDIRLKINTVVSCNNYNEDLSEFITEICPERWKILQVLPISGQNDNKKFEITEKQFNEFVKRNRIVEKDGITVVYENNNMMKGTYVMVDPHGRFVDNVDGVYKCSASILDVGVEQALDEIRIDHDKFKQRGGYYE